MYKIQSVVLSLILGTIVNIANAQIQKSFALKDTQGNKIATFTTDRFNQRTTISVQIGGEDIVIGYTDQPVTDPSLIPDSFIKSIKKFQGQPRKIYYDEWHTDDATNTYSPNFGAPIEPLITTKWAQVYPYNEMIPEIDGQHAVVGCNATALAQFLFYHKAPVFYQGLTGPVDDNPCDWASISEPTQFDFENMLDEYTSNPDGSPNFSQENVDAVAKLMYYTAQSCATSYGLSTSSSFPERVISALHNIFGYNGLSEIHASKTKDSYDRNCIWKEMMYKTLSEGNPILVSGYGPTGGHFYICDGYDKGEYFHFNYGWGGYMDGYYHVRFMTETGAKYGEHITYYADIHPDESYNAGVEDPVSDESIATIDDLEIYSLSGSLLYQGPKNTVDLSSLPSGLLIARQRLNTHKFINR